MNSQIFKTKNIEIKGGIFEYLRNKSKTNLIIANSSPEDKSPSFSSRIENTYDNDPNSIWISDYDNNYEQNNCYWLFIDVLFYLLSYKMGISNFFR